MTEHTGPSGTRLVPNARADEIGVSLGDQRIIVDRRPTETDYPGVRCGTDQLTV